MARRVCEAVDAAFEPEQVPWLQRLVEQPSHTHARDDVEAAFAQVDRTAAELGLRRELVDDPRGRFAAHRVYHGPRTGADDRALALVGHLDTVFPRSLGFLAFAREGDVVRGPGVLDMKSGLSAILFALRALRQVAADRFEALPLRFVCNSDEEVGSPSSAPLFARLAARTRAALVFEAGREGDRIVTRRKGGATVELEVRGRAAHAGNAHGQGVSAIHVLALLVPRIEALTDEARGVTVNVGLFSGGTAKNTVPDHAACTVDARFCAAADGRELVSALEQLARAPWSGAPPDPERLREATIELRGGITRPPLEAAPESQRLRASYERCAAAVGLGTGEAALQGGGSDANLLSAAGVPTIDGLGPFGRHFHEPTEWSSLDSLRRKTQALALFLLDGAQGIGRA